MKSKIFKLLAILFLLVGGFACKNDNDKMGSIKIQCNITGTVDPNIASIAHPDLVNAVCCEYQPDPIYDGKNPHRWTITLFMAKGTDCTKLAPIITLAPDATITPAVSGAVHDYTKGVDWTITAPDGSTVFYTVFASDNNMVSIKIQCSATGVVDPNIVSIALPNLVCAIIYERTPYPNYGGIPECWSPHEWWITLFMEKGTDCTKLAPIITLALGATMTLKSGPGEPITPLIPGTVYDFTKGVYWRLTAPDGSTVFYSVRAYNREIP